jgi:hypothetical protein
MNERVLRLFSHSCANRASALYCGVNLILLLVAFRPAGTKATGKKYCLYLVFVAALPPQTPDTGRIWSFAPKLANTPSYCCCMYLHILEDAHENCYYWSRK